MISAFVIAACAANGAPAHSSRSNAAPRVKVEDPAQLGVYRSSEWAERCFCKQCGTPLFYRLVGKDFYAVSVEAFDDRGDFALTSQIFVDEKPPYYDFANKTKNMTGAEVFAAFGASQDQAKG